MTKKERFAYDLANLCCNPCNYRDIPGMSYLADSLMTIVAHQTKKDSKLKQRVDEWIESLVEEDYYDKEVFGDNKETAIKEAKEDYEAVFYNSGRY